METEIKKRKHRKGGTDYAKEKLAKAEAKIKELEEQLELKRRVYNKNLNEKSETIRKQGTKISDLSGELTNAKGLARDYRRQFEEAVRRMGGFRRFIYGYNFPQFTDEDHWHD